MGQNLHRIDMIDWNQWRRLEHGEIIEEGDYVDGAPNGWHDDSVWMPVVEHDATRIGQAAPDPQFPAHRVYVRRRELGLA